jgi:hypothetical protein
VDGAVVVVVGDGDGEPVEGGFVVAVVEVVEPEVPGREFPEVVGAGDDARAWDTATSIVVPTATTRTTTIAATAADLPETRAIRRRIERRVPEASDPES